MRAPEKLHRINGYDAAQAMNAATLAVNGPQGHVAHALLAELERGGFYLGVADRDAEEQARLAKIGAQVELLETAIRPMMAKLAAKSPARERYP